MTNQPRNETISSAQGGDAAALDELARSIRPQIERHLARYPLSEDDKSDLLQTTLMQVVRRIRSFRGESSFSTWLFRVTANEALMMMRAHRRQRARLVEGLDLDDLSSAAQAAVARDDADLSVAEIDEFGNRVRGAIAELPESYRSVVVAHYHHDLGLQEIAQRLRVSESAVRSRLHRARSRLRSALSQEQHLGVAA